MNNDDPDLHIVLNGASHCVPAGTTVAALLDSLGVGGDGVAVAVDMVVVPRGAHAGRVIQDGERVEIVRAVGGG